MAAETPGVIIVAMRYPDCVLTGLRHWKTDAGFGEQAGHSGALGCCSAHFSHLLRGLL